MKKTVNKGSISRIYPFIIDSTKHTHIRGDRIGAVVMITQITLISCKALTVYISKPQIRSESVCSNQFNCYACVRHQIEANDALVMPL